MKAVVAREPGGPDVLTVRELPDPVVGPGEVLLDVVAAGLNRADLLQRQGLYPPPPGASDVMGLECSGVIVALGEGVAGSTSWQVGDEVCALLAGGGYASQVVVPVGQLLPVPAGIGLVEAAALPEVACTVWSNVWMTAGLQHGDTFLVHGGAGGIGSFAIQLASALGARVITTAGNEGKLELCRGLGADLAVDYHLDEPGRDWVSVVREHGGADVILDNMGAKYLMRNVAALADGGRLVVIGMQGGTRAELDLGALLRKRGSVIATALRSRPAQGPGGKAEICAQVAERVWPLVESGTVKPLVSSVLPLEDAGRAHELLESGQSTGKLLLTIS